MCLRITFVRCVQNFFEDLPLALRCSMRAKRSSLTRRLHCSTSVWRAYETRFRFLIFLVLSCRTTHTSSFILREKHYTGAEVFVPLRFTHEMLLHLDVEFSLSCSLSCIFCGPSLQIWYDMQMATDYKRCSIFVSDTRVVALARGLLGLKAFFVEPVSDFRTRDRMLRPYR